MVVAERSRADSWAVWSVPVFWLLVFLALNAHDISRHGPPGARLLPYFIVEATLILLLCIPLLTRVKRIWVGTESLRADYYALPARQLKWSDVAQVDYFAKSSTGDRILRLRFASGRPILLTRAMRNFEAIEKAVTRRPGLKIATKPGIWDKVFHGAAE